MGALGSRRPRRTGIVLLAVLAWTGCAVLEIVLEDPTAGDDDTTAPTDDDDTTAPADDDDTTAPTDDDDTTAGTDDDDDSGVTDDDDTAPPTGDRSVSGQAWFFDATGVGEISEVHDVTGAEVYLLEYPSRRMEIEPDGLFALGDLPDHSAATVGLEHPDFYPSLTATLPIGTEDVEGVTFQAVTWPIAEFLGLLVGSDPYDPDVCTMVVTVTAISDNQHSVYAPGEPDVVVSVDPPVAPEHGPFYFNTSVIPDLDLAATTTDGGVIVAGVDPGVYVWSAHKDGLDFAPLTLTCVGGTLTNGSPPYGLQATLPEP